MQRNPRHRNRTSRVAVAIAAVMLVTTTAGGAAADTAPSDDDRVGQAVEVIKTFEERGILSKPWKKWNAPVKLSDGVRFISKDVDPNICTGIETIDISSRDRTATPPPACRAVTPDEQQSLFAGTVPDCLVPGGCPARMPVHRALGDHRSPGRVVADVDRAVSALGALVDIDLRLDGDGDAPAERRAPRA